MQGYPTYYISSVNCNDIYLRSRNVFNQGSPPIITKQEDEEIQPLEINVVVHNL